MPRLALLAFVVVATLVPHSAAAITSGYVSVPVRDAALIKCWARWNNASTMPAVLIHTPYGIGSLVLAAKYNTQHPLYSTTAYALVFCDWRGGTSNGTSSTGKDVYDIVQWIATQTWSDGRVGMYGASALGAAQFEGALLRPPALKCIVPIFKNLKPMYKFYYPGNILNLDEYKFLLSLGYLSFVVLPQHPNYDTYWQVYENSVDPSKINIPVLFVGGWWDHSYALDTFQVLQTLTDPAVRSQHRILCGPWTHFATGGSTPKPGEDAFHDKQNEIPAAAMKWFDYHMKGVQNEVPTWATFRYRRYQETTYQSAPVFPPETSQTLTLYLAQDRTLSTSPASQGSLSYIYSPIDPSPTTGGVAMSNNLFRGPADQRPVTARGDAFLFTSSLLSEPLLVEGILTASLDASTLAVDTDFMVRIVDVYPDGTQFLIGDGGQRFKHSPGTGSRRQVAVRITNALSYLFQTGHRIGAILSSSNYPRFDRNLNTGADVWADKANQPYVNTTNTIFFGSATPTAILLPVTPSGSDLSSNAGSSSKAPSSSSNSNTGSSSSSSNSNKGSSHSVAGHSASVSTLFFPLVLLALLWGK
jgi:hypothetical protein